MHYYKASRFQHFLHENSLNIKDYMAIFVLFKAPKYGFSGFLVSPEKQKV